MFSSDSRKLSGCTSDRESKKGFFSKFRFSLRKFGLKKNVRMPTDDELTTASSQCIYTNAPNTNHGASHVIGSSYPISNSSLRRRSYLIAIDQNKSNELLERSVKPSGVMYTVEDDDLESSVNLSDVTYAAEFAGFESNVTTNSVMYTIEAADVEQSFDPSGVMYTAETAANYFGTHEDGIVSIPFQQQFSDETENGLMVRRNIERIVRKRRSSGKLKRGPIQEMPIIPEEDAENGKSSTPLKGVNNPHVNAKKRPPFFARFRSNAKHRFTVSHHPCFKPNELRSIQQMSQLVSKRIRKMSQLASNELDDGSYMTDSTRDNLVDPVSTSDTI